MNPLISAQAVKCVCLTIIILFCVHSCRSKGLSDETAQAVSAACQKVGQAMYVRLAPGEIKAECVK